VYSRGPVAPKAPPQVQYAPHIPSLIVERPTNNYQPTAPQPAAAKPAAVVPAALIHQHVPLVQTQDATTQNELVGRTIGERPTRRFYNPVDNSGFLNSLFDDGSSTNGSMQVSSDGASSIRSAYSDSLSEEPMVNLQTQKAASLHINPQSKPKLETKKIINENVSEEPINLQTQKTSSLQINPKIKPKNILGTQKIIGINESDLTDKEDAVKNLVNERRKQNAMTQMKEVFLNNTNDEYKTNEMQNISEQTKKNDLIPEAIPVKMGDEPIIIVDAENIEAMPREPQNRKNEALIAYTKLKSMQDEYNKLRDKLGEPYLKSIGLKKENSKSVKSQSKWNEKINELKEIIRAKDSNKPVEIRGEPPVMIKRKKPK